MAGAKSGIARNVNLLSGFRYRVNSFGKKIISRHTVPFMGLSAIQEESVIKLESKVATFELQASLTL